MIRTLPNGRTEHTPMTGEAYASAHDLMIAIVDSARRHGIEAVDLTNAALVFIAASIGSGKLDAGSIAATLAEIIRAGIDAGAPAPSEARRSAAILEFAATQEDQLADHGIAALAAAAAKFGRGGWAALVETADQIADRKCRGAVACPACRAERFARTIDEIEQAAATPPPSN
jgi:hypothetical protein